jgi:mRNA-degrading endonuclease toxin of MazEF toxin-antitoxin module
VIITSARFDARSRLPNCVPIRAGSFGLAKDCVAQAETIFSIRKALLDLDDGPIGSLDDETFRDLIRAIGHVLRSDCEPE